MPQPSSAVGAYRRGRGYIGGPASGAHTRHWPSEDQSRSPRASLALLPGRGESVEPFERLAFRLSLDGCAVTFVEPGADSVAALGEARLPGVPFVLVGSDTGALRALSAAGSPAVHPDAVVLLGLPLLHLEVAGQRLDDYPPRSLPDLPILLVHGQDDRVSPLPLVRMTTRTAPSSRLDVVPGGHQVLDGPGGWSVPARVLLFVDGLRGPGAAPRSVPGRQRPAAPQRHVHDDPRSDEVQPRDRDPQLRRVPVPGVDRHAQRA
jgi:alpha-beta hydrolase superfamily lysophospholipase